MSLVRHVDLSLAHCSYFSWKAFKAHLVRPAGVAAFEFSLPSPKEERGTLRMRRRLELLCSASLDALTQVRRYTLQLAALGAARDNRRGSGRGVNGCDAITLGVARNAPQAFNCRGRRRGVCGLRTVHFKQMGEESLAQQAREMP